MAAPTNVRVEAVAITATVLRWTYGDTAGVEIYRSTDGVSYSLITGGDRIGSETLSYTDTGLAVGTKYWYKLTDDSGSTFSSVVTVWTHSCAGPQNIGEKALTLPRFDGEEVEAVFGDQSSVPGFYSNRDDTTNRLNEMARRIEAAFQGQPIDPAECFACPEDGAVVIDCSSGCTNWTVIADEDINSVSITWCGDFSGVIDFVIPPGTTSAVCGFPAGFGFGGDECAQAPINGGINGRRMRTAFIGGGSAGASGSASSPGTSKGLGRGSGVGGGIGGAGCTCVPGEENALTIKSCNPNNSLDCANTKKLRLLACGGIGPYTWSKTGSINLSAIAGSSTTVTPPENTGEAVAGTAFTKAICGVSEAHASGSTHTGTPTWALFNCDDSFDSCSTVLGGTTDTPSFLSTAAPCSEHSGHPISGCVSTTVACGCNGATGAECAKAQSCGAIQDRRTAGMISDGCNPCGLNAEGATVTVTDSIGTQTTIILRS